MNSNQDQSADYFDLIQHPQFGWAFRLDQIRYHKVQQKFACSNTELEELAAYLELNSLDNFDLELMVKPKRSDAYFDIYMRLQAKGAQACIATGEDVKFEIELSETHNVTVEPPKNAAGEIQLNEADLDAPEFIENAKFDPLKVALEMLILELEPYPRKDGVDLVKELDEQIEDEEKPNPFAGLEALKSKLH